MVLEWVDFSDLEEIFVIVKVYVSHVLGVFFRQSLKFDVTNYCYNTVCIYCIAFAYKNFEIFFYKTHEIFCIAQYVLHADIISYTMNTQSN